MTTSLPGRAAVRPDQDPSAARPWFWVVMVPLCAATGILYALVFQSPDVWQSAVHAAIIGSLAMGFERGAILRGFHERIKRYPTLAYFVLAEGTYVALVALGNAVAGLVLWSAGLVRGRLADEMLLTPRILLFALGCSAVLVFLVRVRDLLGAEAFVSLLTGRYHRPVEEERIFLFIDLIGSTAYAERNGDLRTQAFLSAFFAALAGPVRRNGGSIDDYIGDMALITWPMAKGIKDARCIACVFDFADLIERNGPAWQTEFGQMPLFRAALHGGGVVTAEIGVDRHKISYFGDCVNTTARIEALCRTLDAPILISSDMLRRLPVVPHGIEVHPLGDHLVKGRDRRLSVFALRRRSLRQAA